MVVPSGLPRKFVDDWYHGVGIGALFCKHHETLRVVHDEELVPKDYPDGEGDNPDANINQKIGEQVSHSIS